MRDFKTLGEPFRLSKGEHESPQDGMCVMEMVSFLNGEKWSDTPECACPVIGRFCQVLNDKMGQEFRDKLQTYMFKLMGSISQKHEVARMEYLAWAAVTVFAANAMKSAGLTEEYEKLKDLPRNTSMNDLRAAATAAATTATTAAAYAADADVAAYAADADVAAYAAAADAAADAATATAAAYAAADVAAYVAADAADAAAAADAAIIFEVLDEVLKIGPSGEGIPEEPIITLRAAELRELV